MQRSRWVLAFLALCSWSVLAGCPFGSSEGDGEGGEPMVLDPVGGAGEGDGAIGAAGAGGRAGAGSQAGRGASTAGRGAGTAGSGAGSGAGGADTELDGGPAIGPQVPLEELPGVFADAICGALLDCVGPSKLRELTRREDCATTVAAELQAKDFAHMDGAIAAGRVLYDPMQLPACADGIRALGCDVLSQSFPEACVQVLEGNVAVGEACAITAECEGTAFCTSGASCPSTCQPLLDDGATCDGDGQCGDGLTCIGGSCGPHSGDGEPCAGDSGKACALGLSCVGSTDTVAGACAPNAEVQVGDAGDACEPGATLCKEGLSCVFDDATGFDCQAAVASGASCHLGLPGQCPPDEYCDSTEITAAGTCRALPGDGEACVLSDLCRGGNACVAEGTTATCRAIAVNGDACSADAACRSGRCIGGSCQPPPACL